MPDRNPGNVGVRIMRFEIPAGASQKKEFDVGEFCGYYIAKATSLLNVSDSGSGMETCGAGDLSFALGDMGEFYDVSPGDFMYGFRPQQKLLVRNNTPVIKRLEVWVSNLPGWNAGNMTRGL